MVRNFKDLLIWQKSYKLCFEVYNITQLFPPDEKFGLISQLRRAAVSIPSNIAEGHGKKSTSEYIYALHLAYGSLCELETQLLLSKDLGYLENDKFKYLNEIITEVGKMLKVLLKILKSKNKTKNHLS